MKKTKVAALAFAAVLALGLSACGGGEKQQEEGQGGQQEQPAEPLSLEGTWASEDGGQEAVISGDAMEVYWTGDGSRSLYWAGSFDAPTSSEDAHDWVSANDTAKTGSALLASGDETKEFSYADGVISYEVTAMGTTSTVELVKKSDEAVIEVVEPDFAVTLGEAVKTVDQYSGEDVMVVSLEWTNNSDEACSFDLSINVEAFQDGVQLQSAFVDDYDMMAKSLDIQPGTTQQVWVALALTSGSEVTVEVSEMWGAYSFGEKTYAL